VKPAFGEICITWELSYPHACLADLIKRVSRHLKRHPLAYLKFDQTRGCDEQAKAEERDLRKAAQAVPSEVELKWDWKTKTFDAFLSHKITDAKASGLAPPPSFPRHPAAFLTLPPPPPCAPLYPRTSCSAGTTRLRP
jgi:hypothetical protein